MRIARRLSSASLNSTNIAISGEFRAFCLKMFRKCSIPKCNSLRQDVKLHQFPAREEMKMLWLQCIQLGCESEVTSKMFICHKHFEKRFINAKTNRLKSDAYPSLFSDLEMSSGKPSIGIEEADLKKATSSDHNYAMKRPYEHSYSQPIEHTPYKVARKVEVTSTHASTHDAQVHIAVASTSTECHVAVASTSTATHDVESHIAVASSSNVSSLSSLWTDLLYISMQLACRPIETEYFVYG